MPLRKLLRQELTRGIGTNIVLIGLQSVLGLIASVIAARYLGPDGVGIVAIGLLIAEVVSVFDNLASQGFVRDQASRPSPANVATVLGVKGALGLVLTVLLLLAAPLIARVFTVPVVIPLAFAGIPAASIVSSVALMTWEAKRDMVRRNATQLAEAIARLALYALVAFAVTLPLSREAAIAFATLAASGFASLVGLAIIPSLSLRAFDRAKAVAYLKFGLRTQSSGGLQKLLFWFDIMLIDLYWGHAVQGLYKTAYTMMSYLALATGTVSIMLYPTIARAIEARDEQAVRRSFSVGAFASLALAAPLAIVFVAIPGPLLEFLVGPAFLGAAWMLRSLGAIGILAALLVPFETYFPAIGRPDLGLRIAVVEVVVNVALNLVLIPRIGVLGAVVATGISFALGLAMAVWLLRSIGHALPSWSDARLVFAPPPMSPPDEPPRV